MEIVSLPHPDQALFVEPLDYPNAYDFHHPHRHDYFEIILVQKGGGEQWIDFNHYELKTASIYVVYPGQVHLLQRDGAQGRLIQFRKAVFDYLFPVKHHYLYFQNPEFCVSASAFEQFYHLTNQIADLQPANDESSLSLYKRYSYLQILLISLIEQKNRSAMQEELHFASRFLLLLSEQIREKRKVSEYAAELGLSSDRFTELCKIAFGRTPLKLIHEELLLEIKRLIVLQRLSLKEIAYELNFDSPGNFSAFIKTASGKTPTELQQELMLVRSA